MALRGMIVVDAHVHLLPGRLGQKVRTIFEAGSVGPNLAYPNDHEVIVDTLAAEGVDELWTLPYAHKPGVAAGLNEAASGTVAQFVDAPLTVVGAATVHPADDDPAQIVRDAVDRLGLRALKLHCSVGDFDVEDRRLDPVFDLASERRLPVVVHLGHSSNGLTELDELPSLVARCTRNPELVVILAHAGHHSAPHAVRLMDDHANLHVDLTPVVTAHPELDATHLSSHPERVLFGSDTPNVALRVTDGLGWLDALGLDDAILAGIIGGNARRLTEAVLVDR